MNKIAKVILNMATTKKTMMMMKTLPGGWRACNICSWLLLGCSTSLPGVQSFELGRKLSWFFLNRGYLEWPAQWLATLLVPNNTRPIMRCDKFLAEVDWLCCRRYINQYFFSESNVKHRSALGPLVTLRQCRCSSTLIWFASLCSSNVPNHCFAPNLNLQLFSVDR